MKPRILHLSADYPDRFQRSKTRAIAGLVEGTAETFDHLVVSLNRQGGWNQLLRPGEILSLDRSGDLLSLRYAGPPAAVAISRTMSRLADAITIELDRINYRPNLIQGHKLTVEGVLARELSKRMGMPYTLTLQGNTDQKLLRQRPDRAAMIERIWQESKAIMAFAPWTAQWCAAHLSPPPAPVTIIPCVLPQDEIIAPVVVEPIIRTAFNLDFWRNKNIATLLAAVALIAPRFPGLRLEVAGQGSQEAVAAIRHQISKRSLDGTVTLVGAVASAKIQAWFNGSAVFALPSRRESYGMVFAEALLAGTPVIHSQGTAIDGIFLGQPFARSVTANDVNQLAATLAELLEQQEQVKASLEAAQRTGQLDLLRRDRVLDAYREFVTAALP